MDFAEYQKGALRTALYPNVGNNITYPTLGLCGETGEVAEKIKKLYRDRNGVMDEEFKTMLKKEMGDVLWYLAILCMEAGFTLDEVAAHNLEKLASRMERGKLHGDGDTR